MEKSQPQPYSEFVQKLHLAHEFQNLSAMVEDQLAQQKLEAAARIAKTANTVSPLTSTQALLAALDNGDLNHQQLVELAEKQLKVIKGIKKREQKAVEKEAQDKQE